MQIRGIGVHVIVDLPQHRYTIIVDFVLYIMDCKTFFPRCGGSRKACLESPVQTSGPLRCYQCPETAFVVKLSNAATLLGRSMPFDKVDLRGRFRPPHHPSCLHQHLMLVPP